MPTVFRNRLLPLTLCVLLCTGPALAWDGQWTQAESGRGGVIADPTSSHSNAGTPERPQRYFIPPPRDWANVDPEEPGDYKRKDYTPYALARVTQTVKYQGRVLPVGYYLIKPGDSNDGSPNIHLQPAAPPVQPSPAGAQTLQPISDTGPAMEPLPNPLRLTPAVAMPADTRMDITDPNDPDFVLNSNPAMAQPVFTPPVVPDVQSKVTIKPRSAQPRASSGSTANTGRKQPDYNVFVIKKLGNVMAVVPIHRKEHYEPPKGTKVPKQALAWLDMERRNGMERPVLRFYYKKTLYSTDFEPGL